MKVEIEGLPRLYERMYRFDAPAELRLVRAPDNSPRVIASHHLHDHSAGAAAVGASADAATKNAADAAMGASADADGPSEQQRRHHSSSAAAAAQPQPGAAEAAAANRISPGKGQSDATASGAADSLITHPRATRAVVAETSPWLSTKRQRAIPGGTEKPLDPTPLLPTKEEEPPAGPTLPTMAAEIPLALMAPPTMAPPAEAASPTHVIEDSPPQEGPQEKDSQHPAPSSQEMASFFDAMMIGQENVGPQPADSLPDDSYDAAAETQRQAIAVQATVQRFLSARSYYFSAPCPIA